MDFKTYVQSVVATYVEKENKNVIFIKHYNTLDITKQEILADVTVTDDKVFLYHEYAMHDMHSPYAPFLEWIRKCYQTYYQDDMTVENFLKACHVYSQHIEPLAGFIRNGRCMRRADVLQFEIQFETFRMLQNFLSILDYISKEHHLILILSKFHLAPYSTIHLFRSIIDQGISVHAILMYNDEFNVADYKKDIWNQLLLSAAEQNLQLEWGSLDSERTMDVQDEFWFDKSALDEYMLKLRNMYYTFSSQDATYYVGNILNRLDEKTIRLTKKEQLELLELAALIDINAGQVEHALVLCDKLTDMHCQYAEDLYVRYLYFFIYAKARVALSQVKEVEKLVKGCVEVANEMNAPFLACRAEIMLWSTYYRIGKEVFEYDFSYKIDSSDVERIKTYGFDNFLAYLYVFGFENDPETIQEISDGKREPYYFNLGIKIGTELGNDNFLMNAYMKNIILYSRTGHHRMVREMYEKRLGVLRRPNPLRESHMLAGLGYNSIILEDYEAAHDYLMRSVLNLVELEKPDDVMNSLYNLAMNHFVAADYQRTITVIDLIIKMLKEMGYNSIGACSIIKLYSMIAISCYYQKEYYNSYYFLSKMEINVEHMILVLQESNDGVWDEDLLLYHLVKGMLYNYENHFEPCQEQFDKVREKMNKSSSSLFFAVPIYAMEQASLYLKQGKEQEADRVLDEGIRFCEKEELERKKQLLVYFKKYHRYSPDPILRVDDPLPYEQIMQIARHAGTQIKLAKRDKDIRFLTVLQEAISRENMTVEDLYQSTSAVIKSSYNLDEIIILRRQNDKCSVLCEADAPPLPEDAFEKIFDFFKTYKQAFLSNRADKNFTQFTPVMLPFDERHIMTMIGIPLMEESGTETVFLGTVRIKRRTVGSRVLLNGNDLMILKFAFSQFCEMMRRIDNRLMIERMNRKLEQSAITDHLTGITNRNGFSQQAEIICAQGNSCSNVLLYLDLDNFKYYNDTFGHEVGDLVLVTFAEIFKKMTQGNGLAVRYGGDEFIILLYDKNEQDGAAFAESLYREISDGFVDRISQKLGQQIEIPDNKKISCSIGIAAFRGGSKDELELALNHADQSLYYVKRHGKSQYRIYQETDSAS